MKKITFFSVLLMTSMGFSQVNPINFEAGGNGADWQFKVFANGTDPDLQIIANPDQSGANVSATVAKFTALVTGEEYAGVYNDDTKIGTFTLNASNKFVRIKVWKPVISDVRIKLEGPNGNTGELTQVNTLVNQWEVLTFDLSSFVGQPEVVDLNRLTLFPDFAPRTQENIIYFDDITFSATLGLNTTETSQFAIYPNPANEGWTVKSANSRITSVQLVDLQGKQIKRIDVNAFQITIGASTLPQGIYFAIINSEKGVERFKLLKQ